VQPDVAQRDAGLLGQHAQQELLGLRRLAHCTDDKEAGVVLEAAQRVSPAPGLPHDGDGTSRAVQHGELRLEVGRPRYPGPALVRRLPPTVEKVDPMQLAGGQCGHGSSGDVQDGSVVAAFVHQHG
jgi:hypothetical protein